MNQAIRELYRADLARQVTEEGKDAVRRSLYHFIHRGEVVDTTLLTEEDLEMFSKLVLNDR